MDDITGEVEFTFCETYPKHVVVLRWIVLGAAFALGIYILTDIKHVLGIAYVIYSIIALTFILPLSRCAHCFYHGKLCNTGWGKVAAYLVAKGDESKYVKYYNYAIFLHLLWIIPLLASFVQLIRERDLKSSIIFLAYLFVLLVEKIFLKKLGCIRCRLREICPAVPFGKVKR
jgi:hypothetical protein